jgi:hypothetical protein
MADNVYSWTGGARVGWLNSSYPLATLRIEKDQLCLNVLLSSSYTFSPAQVSSLQKFRGIISSGIQIHHCVQDYPSKIIFWCMGNPDNILQKIAASGFTPEADCPIAPQRTGFPLKWSAILFIVIAWNLLLFLGNSHLDGQRTHEIDGWTVLTLLILLLLSHCVIRSEKLQSLLLKHGRTFGEVRHWWGFSRFLLAFMTIIFFLVWLFSELAR